MNGTMKKPPCRRGPCMSLLAIVALLFPGALHAYPPSPHHIIYGTVRDEFGQPIHLTNAKIFLEASSGASIGGVIGEDAEPGVNYRLKVPMDSGLTDDNYKPTALNPTVPFVMKVVIGSAVYLPIEMTGNYVNLGKPAESTRIDLTLGEDTDGDGLPDAWERMLARQRGGQLGIADIQPGSDEDGDGISNLAEYLAGTYAFDPESGFRLKLMKSAEGQAELEFLAVRGHRYTLFISTDMKTWVPTVFSIPDEEPAGAEYASYLADDVRMLRVRVVTQNAENSLTFFKMLSH